MPQGLQTLADLAYTPLIPQTSRQVAQSNFSGASKIQLSEIGRQSFEHALCVRELVTTQTLT